MRPRFLQALLLVCFCSVIVAILFPSHHHNRESARRASCQSNLKQMGLALQQYAADYDDELPLRLWVTPVITYTKFDQLFQCPETSAPSGTTDYFFNARFASKPLALIKLPKTQILFGDGQADAPPNATLTELPAAWQTDENSPSFRHLDMANYLFADGHVKALKVTNVSRDFRMVNP